MFFSGRLKLLFLLNSDVLDEKMLVIDLWVCIVELLLCLDGDFVIDFSFGQHVVSLSLCDGCEGHIDSVSSLTKQFLQVVHLYIIK